MPLLGLVGTCVASALLTAPTASAVPEATVWTCAGRTATIVGTPGDDVLVGTAGPDVIVGRAGQDRLVGLGGDDVLCGDAGSDTLWGGAGNDRLSGGRGEVDPRGYHLGDTFRGGPGDDVFDVGADPEWSGELSDTITFARAAHGVRVDLVAGTARGEGRDRIVGHPHEIAGSRFDDVLIGSPEDEFLVGWRGDDRIRGGAGNDLVDGDASITGRSDTSHGDDVVRGGAGDDDVYAARGSDLLVGGPGNDRLTDAWDRPGGVDTPGRDRLVGGTGDDRVVDVVSAHGEDADGGPGQDRLRLVVGGPAWVGVPVTCRGFERLKDPHRNC